MLTSVSEISSSAEQNTPLIYRGATYHISKQQIDYPKPSIDKIATLMDYKLIYRGNRYKLASIYPAIERTAGLQLIYRGAMYQI